MSVEDLKSLQSDIIRRNRLCNLIGMIFIGVIMGGTIFFVLSSNFGSELPIILFFLGATLFIELIFSLIIISIIKGIVNNKNIMIFDKEFKNIFVLNSLKEFFNNLSYKPENGFSEEYVQNTGMIYTGDSFTSNDYVSGTYKNIKFEQSDIHIQERHEEEDKDGNKKTVWVTIFLGRLMVFDFNKSFSANVQVSSHSFDVNVLSSNKKFVNVKMEDDEFNKLLTVYAENEHDAFYILTPHFMEKIKEITKKLNCGVMFGFIDNRLHIAVDDYNDAFEYNIFKPIDEIEIKKNIVKDIKVITNFVDELSLDNDLFKKKTYLK